jgi:hypothetical protein
VGRQHIIQSVDGAHNAIEAQQRTISGVESTIAALITLLLPHLK